jgi:hypothetical protein
MKCISALFSTLLFATVALPATAQTNDTVKTLSGLHNARYCEVLVIQREDLYKLNASVYSTIHLNNCPEDLWSKMDIAAIKKQFDASAVKLNGPRYFMMDGLVANNKTVNTPVITIGGIQFQKRAEINTNIWDGALGNKLYAPTTVQRYTIWIYNPGTTIYELISPKGEVYVMQSYAQIVDTNLQVTDLPNLGQRLKLPVGWKFQTRTLTQALELKANGVAYVLQDDLRNSYQKE